MIRPLQAFTLAALCGCAAVGATGGAPVETRDGLLAGRNGMTLYTFDQDVAGSGKSACNGPCATNWPPLAAEAGATGGGDYSVIVRDDGSRQ